MFQKPIANIDQGNFHNSQELKEMQWKKSSEFWGQTLEGGIALLIKLEKFDITGVKALE